MKKVLVIFFFTITLSLSGTTYYVATTGKDSNPGTITQPWATWQKGFNSISPGDILYIRGGIYTPTEITTSHSRYCAVAVDSKEGTSGKLYNVWAYPGEIPILDCRNITGTSYERYGILLYNASYWYLKGLTITRVDQLSTGDLYGGQGILVQGDNAATNNTIENCVAHHIGGPGMGTRMYVNETHFINCDSYSNWDPYSDTPGDNADGFDCGYSRGDAIVRFTGCRSWSNGDDGYDLLQGNPTPTIYSGIYYLSDCWAWENGYYPDGVTKGGNGCGFKLGDTQGTSYDGVTRRFLNNCIAYANRTRGFSQESATCKKQIFNCISYANVAWGFSFYQWEVPDILKNNIAMEHDGIEDLHYDSGSGTRLSDHNSWDSGSPEVTSADFVSVDGTELLLPRKADGSLPDINFLRPVAGSDLIDAGTGVGLPYSGKAPDLGAFEMQTGSIISIPVFISSAVENATPSLLVMTYDLNLNNLKVPATSSFIVMVNSVARTVSSVSISGNKVQLTISSVAKFGDVITVSYTKPANNPLQTVSGGEAESIIIKAVTNNCKDANKANVPPVVVIKNISAIFSGFVCEIDATGTYDLNNDNLTYAWTVPNNVSVSSANASKIKFLSPVVNSSQIIEFQLKVNDGSVTVTKNFPVNILPYKPELDLARILNVEASSYQASDYPKNASDVNFSTKWSASGDNQWLLLKLTESFKINYLGIAFLPGQKYSSYFDIYASKDNLIWEPILINATSCNFSGDIQVFDFPLLKTNIAYSYLKMVGHGNSLNSLNNISEFKIFGLSQQNPNTGNQAKNIFIYPNPTRDFFNISVGETELEPDIIRLIDFSGKIVFEDSFTHGTKNVQIPTNLINGVFIVELKSGNLTVFTQKLLVNR